MDELFHAPAPLFRDPVFDGAADPVVIWNQKEEKWWMFYTNRRASVPCEGVAWVHGTDIGVASSEDGRRWIYRGTLDTLRTGPGRDTYWAPEVIFHEGVYHMFVSFVEGIPTDWNCGRVMRHYTSGDLWNWKLERQLVLSSGRVIDACIYPRPQGGWRMWYKDEDHQSHTWAADSEDLYHWQVVGPVITDCAHEGPNVFELDGFYWMITDFWKGLGVYRSEDMENWVRCGNILQEPGIRPDDGARGNHADVLINQGRAWIYYFNHAGRGLREPSPDWNYQDNRTSIQVAELKVENGQLTCDRDQVMGYRLVRED